MIRANRFFLAVLFYLMTVSGLSAADITDITGYTGAIGEEDINWGSGDPTETFTVPTHDGSTTTLTRIPSLKADEYSTLKGVWYVSNATAITDHGAAAGANYTAGNLKKLIDLAGADEVTIELPGNTNYPIVTNLTIPANVTIRHQRGAIFTGAGNIVYSGTGSIDAGNFQIFNTSGTITFADSQTVKSSWFSSLATAVTKISTVAVDLKITADVTLAGNISLPATISAEVLPGVTVTTSGFTLSTAGALINNGSISGAGNITTSGVFECYGSIDGTVTATINGQFIAPKKQVFASGISLSGTTIIEWVYPEWWGAKGDGVTDDSIAFDLAAAFGADIRLSRKTYYTDEFNLAADDQGLHGPGELKAKAGCAGALVTLSGARCVVDGIRIDGNVANQANATGSSVIHGINITGTSCQVINCPMIKDTDGRGVSGQGCDYALIANNNFHNNGFTETTNGGGICLTGADGVRIIGNRVNDPSRYGIRVDTDATYQDSKDIVIADNIVTEHVETPDGNTSIGITVSGAAAGGGNPVYNASITGNLTENASNANAGNSYDTNTVINLTFTGNTGIRGLNGFNPDHDAAGTGGEAGGYQVISGNTFIEPYQRGLLIQGLVAIPTALTVSGNMVVNAGQGGNSGAYSITDVNGASVTGNTATWTTAGTSTADTGFVLGSGIINSVFVGNVVLDLRIGASSKIVSWAGPLAGFGAGNTIYKNKVTSELIDTNGGGAFNYIFDINSGSDIGAIDFDVDSKLTTAADAVATIISKRIPENHVYRVKATIIGTQDNDESKNFCGTYVALFHRPAAGNAILTGAVDTIETTDNTGNSVAATIAASSTAVIVTIDPNTATSYHWRCYVEFMGISE